MKLGDRVRLNELGAAQLDMAARMLAKNNPWMGYCVPDVSPHEVGVLVKDAGSGLLWHCRFERATVILTKAMVDLSPCDHPYYCTILVKGDVWERQCTNCGAKLGAGEAPSWAP